ncbi:tRNA (N(6)-L-threonylcarbamoyladenosine(37)-C(2))-methylthiotransferase MtaB [Geomobilimonas luticola]|uniref:tRNA (N(6)-L-threonylcarbamoyladenosine(37)-C(2))-methylthiotransferase n=1 Tax=Geomobilimonas luticola TaxID=1114878 RepID=A0ABS5SE80_9BACT|nr:tRNA (N(6)-L-threonylcarbamoyladenosine(37)-C(2))-methylthiotransferase MtaB [Geomobilimonas luticola]MBT0653653.1 tRNA (N(6)-L-threonylcarbamoyladenosine(37)-C(2))-methylthiotransferase MtaB [Geomobilimonas luticola]
MQTVAITTLGCKINQFESAAMGEALGKEGFQLLPFEAAADIYVINTCTVTAKTDAESRKLIRRARRRNPAARIVVTGCYAQVAFEELQEMEGVNLIIGNLEKKGLVGLLRELGDEQRVLVSDISRVRETEGTHLESFTEHTRAFLQVQNGCDAFCSYCIVPYARGGSRSVPLAEALAGVRTFAAAGFQEVVLTGIHLGGYGLDLNPPITLLHLLKGVEEGRLVPRLRVGSVEPTEVTRELIAFLTSSRTVCPHFHIPLQSGDDQVLQRMNRNYTTARFRDVVESLVTAIPDVCIGCDIIAGFPGETAEEFTRTLEFIQSLPLAYLHVFPFSPREGTPAATMVGQVNPSVIRERAQALRRVSDEKRRAYFRRFLGRVLPVLVLRPDSDGLVHGLSRNYLPMVIAGGDELVNREVPVRIVAVERELVRGEVIL